MNTEDIKERIKDIKDHLFSRKLGYVKIPFSEDEKASYGNFQAYMPLKYAKKLGLEENRELDTFDYAAGSIKYYKREKPLFDGIIMDSAHNTVQDAEKAMEYIATKYKLPVSALLNGRCSVKNPNQQMFKTNTRLD